MDAVEYLKVKAKICQSIKDDDCKGCVLKGNAVLGCHTTERRRPEECVAQVKKWAAEHSSKTRQSEFLKIFPNASIENGIIKILPCHLDSTYLKRQICGSYADCKECKKAYWLAEVE